jgi:transposase InsO family protein
LKRRHTDVQCLRHTNKAKFEELNQKQFARSNKPRFNKPPFQRPNKVAAIRETAATTIEDSLGDSLGNSLIYNNEDIEMFDYVDSPKKVHNSSTKGSNNPIIRPCNAVEAASRFLVTVPNFASPQMAYSGQVCAVKSIKQPASSMIAKRTDLRKEDNRIFVPIKIQGGDYTALLDPGSTHSYIDKTIAEELRIKCSTLPNLAVEMGEAGTIVNKVITNERLNLICNGRTVEWQVGVITHKYYDFLIGMDLFPRFGYRIEGIELPISPREDIYVIEDKPSIIPEDPIEIEQQPSFVRSKETFMKKIDGALQSNALIDPKSHCPLDIMRVELKVKEDCVIQERSRRFYAQTECAEVDATVKKWLDNGIIIPAPKGNPYNNSLTLAARRNLEGVILKYRVCLDPRKLNKQLAETDNFPLPIINDILEKVAGHKYFTTLDLSQAYHRLPLDEKSQPYTAFTYRDNQYMFARAPFGLKPMTSIFQRGMAHLLGDLHFVSVYVDDIVIYSNTMDEHLEHVKIVIERLTKARLIINKEKSHFFRTQVVLLGFLVDANGKRINPEKVANVKTWAPPTNGKMVQRYLGMFNYFREYIPLYSTIAAPLDRLRNVKGNFKLSDLEMKCFEQLKHMVTEAPVLSFPDFTQPFYVATDASNLGIGAVLYQLPNGPQDESKVNYISFMARSLKPHEKNYPAYKKELLGVIYACKKFHYYLWGRKFTLYTDHRPLTYIHEQNELPQIIADWKETLFSYNFDCVYRPGILNIIPDALSRAFPEELWAAPAEDKQQVTAMATRRFKRLQHEASKTAVQSTAPNESETSLVELNTPIQEPVEILPDVPEEVQSDVQAEIPVASAAMAEQLDPMAIDPKAAYVQDVQDEPMFQQVKDETEQQSLLKEVHSFGHPGANAMVTELHKKGVTWPKLKEACIDWIKQCSDCQRFNIVRKGYHPLKAIHATLPGEHLAIDLATFSASERGNVYVLLVVDVCSRFVFLKPIMDKAAQTVAASLYELFCAIGFPKILQSDRGPEFLNDTIKSLTEILGIDKRVTTAYHPRANGVAERHVRSMKDLLKKELKGLVADWDLHLPKVQLIMNTRVASLHGSTPFSLFYGRSFPGFEDFKSVRSDLATPEQLKQRLEYLTALVYPAISEKSKQTQKRMIDKFNASHYLTEFPDGSYVMIVDNLAAAALDPPYDGPFCVVRRTGHGTYVLKEPTGRIVDRNFAPEQLKHAAPLPDDAVADDDIEKGKHYQVTRILSHRIDEADGNKVKYLVNWKGYKQPTEITFDHFDSKKMVQAYHKKRNEENPHIIAKKTRHVKRVIEGATRSSERLKKTKPDDSIGGR